MTKAQTRASAGHSALAEPSSVRISPKFSTASQAAAANMAQARSTPNRRSRLCCARRRTTSQQPSARVAEYGEQVEVIQPQPHASVEAPPLAPTGEDFLRPRQCPGQLVGDDPLRRGRGAQRAVEQQHDDGQDEREGDQCSERRGCRVSDSQEKG